MTVRKWSVARRADSEVTGALERIAASIKQASWNLSITLAESQPPLFSGTLESAKDSVEVQSLLGRNEPIAFAITAVFPNIPGGSIQLRRSHEATDEMQVHLADGHPPQLFLPMIISASAEFPSLFGTGGLQDLVGEEVANFYRAREQGLSRMEGLNLRLTEETQSYRLKLDEQTDELRSRLQAEHDSLRRRLENDADERQKLLDEKEAELAAQKNAMDDRQSRHARRALRQELQAELKARSQNFGLTKDTNRKRTPIHWMFISFLVLDAVVLSTTIMRDWARLDEGPVIVKIAAGVVGFAFVLFLYIRWSDQWFRQHADEEFRLKRMSLDVDRASWVVETAMEWQSENKGPIPAQLLEELTRGLFVTQPGSSSVRHPVEDFTSAVLGASSKAEIDIPGRGKFFVERGGMKKLNDAIDESAKKPD